MHIYKHSAVVDRRRIHRQRLQKYNQYPQQGALQTIKAEYYDEFSYIKDLEHPAPNTIISIAMPIILSIRTTSLRRNTY